MMKVDLNKMMHADTDKRNVHLHVKISKRNKAFLKKHSEQLGVVMGLYLDKLLTTLRTEVRDGT